MDQNAYKKNNKPEDGGKIGVYKHVESGETLPAESFAQADAFIRQGWVYEGPLPSRLEVAERDKKALEDQISAAKQSSGNAQLDALNNEVKSAKADEKSDGNSGATSTETMGAPTHPPVDMGNTGETGEVPSAPVTKNTPKALKENK